MNTCASIFGGFGGFECGAVKAGLRPVWTVEMDADITGVYESNFGPHAIVAKAEDVDYSTLESPFWLHMSPVCKNASVAKAGGVEGSEDMAMAEACARAIRQCRAAQISLENVWGYRSFESFRVILRALEETGYAFDYWHLNCADYGVPQTRKRLILLASKAHRPRRPPATHREQADMFLPAWVGWYEAIEDLIPTLPESKFAPWQLKRLPEHVVRGVLVDSQNAGQEFGKLHRTDSEPSIAVVTDGKPSHMPRAFLLEGAVGGMRPPTARYQDEPCFTYTANNGSGRHNPTRAFLVGGASEVGEPSRCVNASNSTHWRAFVLDGRNTRTSDNEPFTVRKGREPFFSVTASDGSERHRAFIEGVAQRQSELFTPEPAWLAQGRVVSMTARALARFQSITDDFELPDKNALACKGIGNALPPLLAERFVESELKARESRAA